MSSPWHCSQRACTAAVCVCMHKMCPSLLPCLQVRLCSKLELLDRCLVKLRAGGHKVGAWAAAGRLVKQCLPRSTVRLGLFHHC